MNDSAPFRSGPGRASCLAWYERQIAALGVAHEERDVDTAAAGRTHVVIAGPAPAAAAREIPPLFLVHGAGASAAMLRDEIAYYAAAGFRVFAPDIPGHLGRSEPRKLPLSDTTIGRWLDELIAAAGLPDALLLGYSFGGFAVLKLAEYAPNRIRRGIAIVPAGLSPPSVWRGRRVVFARAMLALTKSAVWRERMLAPMFAPGFTPIPFNHEFGLLTIEHWIPDLRPYPLFQAAQLQRLTAPFLVLAAEMDPFFDHHATLAAARRVIPGVTAECIDGCGHMFDAEHIDGVRARTLAFLQAGRSPAGSGAT